MSKGGKKREQGMFERGEEEREIKRDKIDREGEWRER